MPELTDQELADAIRARFDKQTEYGLSGEVVQLLRNFPSEYVLRDGDLFRHIDDYNKTGEMLHIYERTGTAFVLHDGTSTPTVVQVARLTKMTS